jgi:hypothetical protein
MNTAQTSTDWAGLIMASNEAAMQWYSLVSQKPLPTSGNVFTVGPGGMSVGTNANWLVLGALAFVAFLVFRK